MTTTWPIIINYHVASALTEANTILSLRDEKLVSTSTHCRLCIRSVEAGSVGQVSTVTTQVLVLPGLFAPHWFSLRTGASERLVRAMVGLIADGSRRQVAISEGVLSMDLGNIEDGSTTPEEPVEPDTVHERNMRALLGKHAAQLVDMLVSHETLRRDLGAAQHRISELESVDRRPTADKELVRSVVAEESRHVLYKRVQGDALEEVSNSIADHVADRLAGTVRRK